MSETKKQRYKQRTKDKPNAKKKVKIAEKMFPRIAETAKLQISLTLSTKFPNEEEDDEEEEEKRDGCAIKSIFSFGTDLSAL